MNKNNFSLAIVTRNRPEMVAHCLVSILTQSLLPKEVLILDNSSDKKTQIVVKNFKTRTALPLKYVFTKTKGFPALRQEALNLVKTTWIVFIDDDCLLQEDHVLNTSKAIAANTHVAAILGESGTLYPEKTSSVLRHFIDSIWKKKAINLDNTISDLEILDDKNVALNKEFLKKNKIRYDINRTRFNGASQDSDLGMQIQSNGGAALYNSGMKVLHKDFTSWHEYYPKLIVYSLAHQTYEEKWHSFREGLKLDARKKSKRIAFLNEYLKSSRLSFFQRLSFLCNLLVTFLLVKFLKIYKKHIYVF